MSNEAPAVPVRKPSNAEKLKAALVDYGDELRMEFEKERHGLHSEIARLQHELESARFPTAKRPTLDEMTLAEMEQLASRVSAAVEALREARPFMGGTESRSAAPPTDVEGPVPLRPPPPPIDHPRAKGKVVLSPEEEGRKRALLRANRGDDVKESA